MFALLGFPSMQLDVKKHVTLLFLLPLNAFQHHSLAECLDQSPATDLPSGMSLITCQCWDYEVKR